MKYYNSYDHLQNLLLCNIVLMSDIFHDPNMKKSNHFLASFDSYIDEAIHTLKRMKHLYRKEYYEANRLQKS